MLVLADDSDAVSGHGEACPVGLRVDPYRGSLRDVNALVQDRVPHHGTTANPNTIQ